METASYTSATEVVQHLTNLLSEIYSLPLLRSGGLTIQIYSLPLLGSNNIKTQFYFLPLLGSSGVTSQIEEVLNQFQQDWIIIPIPAEVRDYLLRYPDLTNLLPYVSKMVRERVGLYTQLSLEVYHDPEIEDEYLTLYIRQEHYDENILNIIEDIRTQYEEKLIGRSGWFLLTTDFRPPK